MMTQTQKDSQFVFEKNVDDCLTVEIFPSMACPIHCPHCDRSKDRDRMESFEDIQTMIDNLLKDVEKVKFRISGGEPTFYPKINELINYLHSLNPERKIDLQTNFLGVKNLTISNLEKLIFRISVYPGTVKMIKQNKVTHIMWQKLVQRPVEANTLVHEDLKEYGTIKKTDFDPMWCFAPVLYTNTKKVYPCCRGEVFEKMYGKKYHLEVDTPNLYQGLKDIIHNTDMCSKCPRMYEDPKLVPIKETDI